MLLLHCVVCVCVQVDLGEYENVVFFGVDQMVRRQTTIFTEVCVALAYKLYSSKVNLKYF